MNIFQNLPDFRLALREKSKGKTNRDHEEEMISSNLSELRVIIGVEKQTSQIDQVIASFAKLDENREEKKQEASLPATLNSDIDLARKERALIIPKILKHNNEEIKEEEAPKSTEDRIKLEFGAIDAQSTELDECLLSRRKLVFMLQSRKPQDFWACKGTYIGI